MREKSGSSRNPKMIGLGLLGFLIGLFLSIAPTLGDTGTTSPDMETCQCGVFLLGLQPLVFSADAKPILSGMPVPANCSAKSGKLECATICRQLIETMSQTHETAAIQTVVLAATRTLACQRFNESTRVPVPRNLDATGPHQARLDDQTNKWKFIAGPLARSELGAETASHNAEQNNGAEEDSDGNSLGKLTEPKYLGGFYRWCDEHWIYAGVSLHDPLCCLQHLPKKCPTPAKSARNGRRPRLIIRRCKNDDCSSEEDFQNLELSAEVPSTSKTPPTTETLTKESEETESPDNFDNATSSEVETINPFDTTQKPVKNRKPLNSTVVAEAFKFVSSLMDSLGYGDVVQGITSVLPTSTASELLERVDVGGWVTNYQDRYMSWPREFSMGYCYVEYSLYNMASDGFMATTNNILSRVFKPQSPGSAPSRSSMPPHAGPPPLGDPPQAYGNNPNNVNNYISPMAPLPENSFNGYGQPNIGIGNRRVRRSPGVTVSRSYSSAGATVRRKVIARARNAPSSEASEIPVTQQAVPSTAIPVMSTPSFNQVLGNASGQSFAPTSSFVPTNYQGQPQTRFFSEPHQPIPLNPHYHRFQPELAPRTHNQQAPPNLVEYARPRRNPPFESGKNTQNQNQSPQTKSKGKEGPSGPSLMNIANMLVQTAMAGNGQSDGDKVTSIMQNALPLVSQVATNPAIQSMVSSLVTSFLTPPHAKPRPTPTPPPSQNLDDDEESWEAQEDQPVKTPPRKPESLDSNEVNEPEATSSNNKPSNNGPPTNGGGGSIISTMLSKMISTYIEHLFSPGTSSNVNREPTSDKNKPSRPSKPGDDSKPQPEGESKDIVEMISGVAKPFFISYFGVVPGEPGFGKLRISDRRDRLRFDNNKEGGGPYKTEILQNDPDPGTGITDVLLGSVNLPETGNSIYDFGNRVVYAFSRANDPQQGMYCFKQYTVNKMWDYFRFGVRAVFKK